MSKAFEEISRKTQNLPRAIFIDEDEAALVPYPVRFETPAAYEEERLSEPERQPAKHNDHHSRPALKTRGPVRLSEVPIGKLVVLSKNRVAKDELIRVPVNEDHSPWNIRPQKTLKRPQQKVNDQVSENDQLFSHGKIMEERRQRKQVRQFLQQNFLNNIQHKLEALEQEAGELQKDFRQDQQQLQAMNEISSKVNRQLHDYKLDRKVCRLEKEIEAVLQNKQPCCLVNPLMTVGEINSQLNNLYDQNEKLFNEIDGKVPSVKDTKNDPKRTTGGFQQTLKAGGTLRGKNKSRSKSKGKKITPSLASTLKAAP